MYTVQYAYYTLLRKLYCHGNKPAAIFEMGTLTLMGTVFYKGFHCIFYISEDFFFLNEEVILMLKASLSKESSLKKADINKQKTTTTKLHSHKE